mgnify:CR=1 FL=1
MNDNRPQWVSPYPTEPKTCGKSEAVAFARGALQLTGVMVGIDHSAQPCTDQKTISINCDPCGVTEYHVRTGVTWHEIAHNVFRSVENCTGWGKAIATQAGIPWAESAAHCCVNVALDLFDETSFERLYPSTKRSLELSNVYGLLSRIQNATLIEQSEPGWKTALCGGILGTRVTTKSVNTKGQRVARYNLLSYMRQCGLDKWGNFPTLLAICKRCKFSGANASNQHRTPAQWARIRALATDLFDAIKPALSPNNTPPCPPPEPDKGQPDGSTGQQDDGQGQGQGNDVGAAMRNKLVGKGQPKGQPQQGQGSNDGDSQSDSSGQSDSQSDGQSNGQGTGSTPNNGCGDYVPLHLDLYGACCRTLSRAFDRIAETDEAMRGTRYLDRGATLGKQWVNALTNGRVFAERDKGRDRSLSVALLLDRSSSMSPNIGEVGAACAAIAKSAMGIGANLRCWAFGSSTDEIDPATLRQGVALQGATLGDPALKAGLNWLATERNGRKVCLILTDGAWSYGFSNDGPSRKQMIVQATKRGVEIVVVGIAMQSRETLLRDWPIGTRGFACRAEARELSIALLRELT